ncbi:MAG: hypothetical protein ACR2P5_00020 [Gammaproteobacteria bacterium]
MPTTNGFTKTLYRKRAVFAADVVEWTNGKGGTMAKKSHPYIEAIKISALVFGAAILFIFFLALFVAETVRDGRAIEPARTEKNITPPGRLYSR